MAATLLGSTAPLPGRHLTSLDGIKGLPVQERLKSAVSSSTALHLPGVRITPDAQRGARWLDLHLIPISAAPHVETAFALVILDATERERERDRADLFYQSFRHSHDPMELTDRQGILVDVNPAFERVYGYARKEAIGQKPSLVRSPVTTGSTAEEIWKAILDPSKGRWSGELVNRDRSGRDHPVRLTIDAIRNHEGEITHFMGVATDLSEIRSLHLQAVTAERLASLGQLAAGVAHEINTPLANILLIAEALRRPGADPAVAQRAETVIGQVEVANRIVAGLLDFARSRPPDRTDVDLVSVVEQAVGFLSGKQSPDVEIRQEHAQCPLTVRADRPQILQVFVNILSNAYDAMGGRGRVTIRSGVANGVAWVSFLDTGSGIPASLQSHIFEPFFTTKPEGKGTGLGLAICHGIVANHGGRIRLEAPEGAGATFVVELPSVPPTPARRGTA